MLKLAPSEVHNRLVARWSSQALEATLLSTINISLAFGSELVNIEDDFGHSWMRPFFVTVSLWGFFANTAAAGTVTQLTADIGRIEDRRMVECVKQHGAMFVGLDTRLLGPGLMLTVLQILFAVGAIEPYALPGSIVGFFWFAGAYSKTTLPAEFVYPNEFVGSTALPKHPMGGNTQDNDFNSG